MKKWLKERMPVKSLDYEVPSYANTLPFSLGGLTIINILLLAISGFILAQFYSSNPENANQSLRYLINEIPLGNVLRGIHYWAAQLVMVFLFIHLLRVYLYGSYKKPREVNWLLGVIMFFLMVGLYYTGTILKWDQEGFEALAHMQAIFSKLGPLGHYFNQEFTPRVSLLEKFQTLHISTLPIVLILAVVAHILLVRVLKISELPYKASNKTEEIQKFSIHLKKLAAYGLVNTGLVVLLATLFPPGLGSVPVAGIEATKPPWLFMSIFTIENWLGLIGLVGMSVLLAVVLIVIPFADRKANPAWKDRKVFVGAGIIAVLAFFLLTVIGYVSEPEQHIGMGQEKQETSSGEVEKQQEKQDNQISRKEEQIEEEHSTTLEGKILLEELKRVIQLQEVVQNEDVKNAIKLSKALDESVDSIGKEIKNKNPSLRKELGTDIHELEEILESGKIHDSELQEILNRIKTNLEKAIELF